MYFLVLNLWVGKVGTLVDVVRVLEVAVPLVVLVLFVVGQLVVEHLLL
jgi:hypothetical protein